MPRKLLRAKPGAVSTRSQLEQGYDARKKLETARISASLILGSSERRIL